MMCRLVLENKSTMLKFTWLPGRQANCIYHKLLFLWIKIPFLKGPVFADGWIIRYPPHAELPMHRDSIKKYASVIYRDRVYECTLNNPRHYRLNIQLWGRGKFLYEGKKMWEILCFEHSKGSEAEMAVQSISSQK